MKITIIAVCLLVCAIAQVSALKCYSCKDCRQLSIVHKDLHLVKCEEKPGIDIFGLMDPKCVKEVKADGTVDRYCGHKTSCALNIDKCEDPEERSCRICCTGNACNSALMTKAAWLPVLVSLTFVASVVLSQRS